MDIKFRRQASYYCRGCDTWVDPAPFSENEQCENCKRIGLLIPNPFPRNLIPYVDYPLQEQPGSLLSDHEVVKEINHGMWKANQPLQEPSSKEGEDG